jgi:hypothetical protein
MSLFLTLFHAVAAPVERLPDTLNSLCIDRGAEWVRPLHTLWMLLLEDPDLRGERRTAPVRVWSAFTFAGLN